MNRSSHTSYNESTTYQKRSEISFEMVRKSKSKILDQINGKWMEKLEIIFISSEFNMVFAWKNLLIFYHIWRLVIVSYLILFNALKESESQQVTKKVIFFCIEWSKIATMPRPRAFSMYFSAIILSLSIWRFFIS